VTAADSTLLLIPSELELNLVAPQLPSRNVLGIELCGFGPIVAAARTAQLLAWYSPKQVILLGIAGSLADNLQIGFAYQFDRVACFGVGVETESGFQTAGDMGWQQWAREPAVGDWLLLSQDAPQAVDTGGPYKSSGLLLLTSCSASGSRDEAARRLARFPHATAEDMEGFAVAAACRLAGVPLKIIRGISNRAGNRQHHDWKVEQALLAAAKLTGQVLEHSN
jgi:futalosine hydrolase